MKKQPKIFQICNGLNNVGDRLAAPLTELLFGVRVRPVLRELPTDFNDAPVLAGLGSFLGYYGEWHLHVWGTGFEPGYVDSENRLNPGSRRHWIFHAVRGHVTRTWFKLSADTPVGDPALLAPRIYEPRPYSSEKIRYFTHCNNKNPPPIDYAEVISTEMDPFAAIDRIVSSDFVFTEALHIAILAHAYGIPWAWSLNKHNRGMVKWYDWFSSIDVAGRCFFYEELTQALKWYDRIGRYAAKVDTDKLLKVFPRSLAIEVR